METLIERLWHQLPLADDVRAGVVLQPLDWRGGWRNGDPAACILLCANHEPYLPQRADRLGRLVANSPERFRRLCNHRNGEMVASAMGRASQRREDWHAYAEE